jgi:hypothetical protein
MSIWLPDGVIIPAVRLVSRWAYSPRADWETIRRRHGLLTRWLPMPASVAIQAARLAASMNATVFALDYRLAPEYTHPAALDVFHVLAGAWSAADRAVDALAAGLVAEVTAESQAA